MQAIIEQQIEKAGIRPGEKLLIAVSGGVDSVVLLHLLHKCSSQLSLSLNVAHLDHQLRPESSNDADFVQGVCADLGVSFFQEKCNVAVLAEAEKVSLEMAARQARRDFLSRVAEKTGARLIALAHHRNDQVETFLMRLLRGSGVAGLASMRSLDGLFWRPMLGISREQILTYAKQHKLEWVEDASNSETIFLRNRIRHQVLEQLRDINPRLDERLAELCRQLQSDEDYWQKLVDEQLAEIVVSSEDGIRLDSARLVSLSESLLVRVLRKVLCLVRGDLQGIDAGHLAAIVAMLRGERSQAQLDLPDCWVVRRYEFLWFRQSAPVVHEYELDLSVPGVLDLPCGRKIRCELVAVGGVETDVCVEFDVAALTFPLKVRSWRAGDRFSPSEMAGRKKLKRLFSDRKLEREDRLKVPLLVSGDEILWVAGLRRSSLASVTGKSTEILRVELIKEA